MSIFEAPIRKQFADFNTPPAASHNFDLPAELQNSVSTPTRPSAGAVSAFGGGGAVGRPNAQPGTPYYTPARQQSASGSSRSVRPQRSTPPRANSQALVQTQQQVKVEKKLEPIPRAAATVNEYLSLEERYPELDNLVSQGQSSDYEVSTSHAWAPFDRTELYQIPDQIFEQYNQTECHTIMGLFGQIGHAWMAVDNRLFMWDYATGDSIKNYDAQSHNITCVKLLKPKAGVFIEAVNYVLAIGTTTEVLLLGVSAIPKAGGGYDVGLFDTKMSVPTKGIDVSVIEGSAVSGRIFFGGRNDNDLYEFTYQEHEGWFHGRSSKVCHTAQPFSAFTPKLPFVSRVQDTEYLTQIVIDDSRNLLYTLSSKSTIRVFHLAQDGKSLPQKIAHTMSQTLSNVRVMIAATPLLSTNTRIVSISAVPSAEARRTHLIATTSTGCRLYLSAVSTDWSGDSAPTSMQVVHVRFPPSNGSNSPGSQQLQGQNTLGSDSTALSPTKRAAIYPPGYFFDFVRIDETTDKLFISAPDSARIMWMLEHGQGRLQLIESACWIQIESRVEAIEMISPPFSASNRPAGFGNETAVQFDKPPSQVAILTNTGIHVMQRRRLVEVFTAALKYGISSSPIGVEGEAKRFFETYGRAESCATALAVACGKPVETVSDSRARVTDVDLVETARKYFIEFGGKPRADDVFFETSALPSLDSIRLSGRYEGIATYIARIVRSIWKAHIVIRSGSPQTGITHAANVSRDKLRTVQEQLVRLQAFLDENRNFIDGLGGAESLMRVGSRVDEVAQQAEHRALHALVQLISSIIEGIAFVLVLFEDKLDEIIMSLAEPFRTNVAQLTYEGLFTSEGGKNLAKELVRAIVNRQMSTGESVDAVADALRRRCGSFCSTDDVIMYKAIEQQRKARATEDPDTKVRFLREALRLFEQTESSKEMDNLKEHIAEFNAQGFFPASVVLALTVAKGLDRGNMAVGYLSDGMQDADSRVEFYRKRLAVYQLVFDTLDQVDKFASTAEPDSIPIHLRDETWELAYDSDDEVFHSSLYDWLFEKGLPERLLNVESSFILPYLIRRASNKLDHAELLWQYYARRDNFFAAAEVLYELAKSPFKLTLEKRLEYYSRAKGFCSSHGPYGIRQKMNELSHTIQDELDIAVIQDDILRRIKEDVRIQEDKKRQLIEALDDQVIPLTDLFNDYASPYSYFSVCLSIFQAADFRGLSEIRKCWENLILQTHEQTLAAGTIKPYEAVSETIRRLGHRFATSEHIFPPVVLVPALEAYAAEKCADSPPKWVVDTLLEAGISHDMVLRILEEMYYRDELPFQGGNRKKIVRDAVYVAERWFLGAARTGRGLGGFRAEWVIEALEKFGAENRGWGERERIERLLADIRRRLAV